MKNLKLEIASLMLAGSLVASANEALDLLEGKITEDETTPFDFPEEPKSGEEGEEAEPKVVRDERDYSRRWRRQLPPLFSLVEQEENPIVQRVAVDGLVEWGYVSGDLEQERDGAEDQNIDDNELRRARLGGVLRAFYNTDLEGRVVFDGEGYQGVDTLKATVQVNDGVQIEAGKFRPPFSQEYKQDSSVRNAPGLSPIVAMVAPANTLGAKVTAWSGLWEMGLGWFSGDVDENIPGFGESGFVLASLAYTFDGSVEVENGDAAADAEIPPGHQRWHLDYIYNTEADADPTLQQTGIPNNYRHLVSTGVEVSSGNFDFMGDFILANGDQNTAWGMNLLGRYWLLEDALRFVGRYSYADTDDVGGLLVGFGLPGAEGDATQPLAGFSGSRLKNGDEYHSFYGGLDWHLFDDYLMLSTGLEYRLLKDEGDSSVGDSENEFSGLFWQTSGRVAF